ncbi:threonine/serine exporter family protein [Clostridium sp. 19966]|uniref:threonine/serine exporter family protein n=1 Tax=Clostridium sp. 19966 TaxID=2768166 RepID=UPI0028DF8AE5|nr:threonine/serine exporter family protein [Clostridium sp. 19966]MDT8716251.1 threonine/serine exporter family protein [Clostridium sp. 19966]
MVINSIYAAIATIGFGIIFNVKGKNLFLCAIGGGASWFIYLLSSKYTDSIALSMFASSVFIGIYSEIMARVRKAPVTIFVLCTIIPLVPGGGMYYTMYYSIKGDVYTSLSTGLNTIMSAGALAVGILFVSSAVKLIKICAKNKD